MKIQASHSDDLNFYISKLDEIEANADFKVNSSRPKEDVFEEILGIVTNCHKI